MEECGRVIWWRLTFECRHYLLGAGVGGVLFLSNADVRQANFVAI